MRIIEWEDFIAQRPGPADKGLAMSIGVFDGVHRGHQALIERICSGPYLPTVITFKQNPLRILKPRRYVGDIFSLAQKLRAFELLGVRQVILIDFSENFSIIRGGDFIDLLVKVCPLRFLALGRDFRCGRRLDTGVREIREQAGALGIETWAVAPVMEGERRISSSRIRQAISDGALEEAEKLLGRKVALDLSELPIDLSSRSESGCCYDAAAAFRIIPCGGRYKALVYGADSVDGIETLISISNGKVLVPDMPGGNGFKAEMIEFIQSTQ
ncbi:MAG: FAD synthetase family protein [Treponema sp.]|jgi:riboflavin kinase/FMN adenylyltransferase|nr:FAD synthetase family protein [Treponema sp.]